MKKTTEALKIEAINFALKPEDWRIDDEKPPEAATIIHAIAWIEKACALGLNVEIFVEIFPGADNSIFVSSMAGDMCCEIEVSRHAILLSAEQQKGIGAEYEIVELLGNPSERQATELLGKLVQYLPKSARTRETVFTKWVYLPQPKKELYQKQEQQCIYESTAAGTMTRGDSDTARDALPITRTQFRCSPQIVSKWVDSPLVNTSTNFIKVSSPQADRLAS